MKAVKTIILSFIYLLATGNIQGQSFISIDLQAYKLSYDGKRDKIYATVKSLDPNYGNTLVQINPHTGVIEKSVFVGSEPTSMDMTKDTNYVYIGLSGASLIKRVNLGTFQVDKTISLGNGQFGAYYAEDVATINLTPDLVIVSRKYTTVEPRHGGVAAYLRGIKLGSETPGHTGSNVIESATDTNLVFGYDNESSQSGIRRMQIDTSIGVILLDATPNFNLGTDFEFQKGLLYANSGKIIDPFLTIPTILGSYANVLNNFKVEPDFKNNKTFFCIVSGGLKIRRYNLQTQVFIDETTLATAVPNYFQLPETSDIIRYGVRGLAIIVSENYATYQDRRIILYESCLVIKGPDIMISTEGNNAAIYPDDTLNKKIIVSNKGGMDATQVIVLDTLDTSFKIISSTASSGNFKFTGNILEWTIDTVKSTKSDTAILKIHFTQQGIFSNRIYAKSAGFDCNTNNNMYSDSITVNLDVSVNNSENIYHAVTAFPNPALEFVYLDFYLENSSEKIELSITDVNGKIFIKEQYSGYSGYIRKKIDLHTLINGIYLLTAKQNKFLTRKKIVKL